MATKKQQQKSYLVYKRYDVWVSQTITATDFDDAVAIGRALDIDDFVSRNSGTDYVNVEAMPGFQVGEQF